MKIWLLAILALSLGCKRQEAGYLTTTVIASSETVTGLAVTMPLKVPLSLNPGDLVQLRIEPTADGEVIGLYVNNKYTGEVYYVLWKNRPAVRKLGE